MPDPRPVLHLLSKTMHAGAILGYWAPSITQIASTIQYIKLQRCPFYVEKVLEFANGTGGARVWDVRLTKVRSRVRAAELKKAKARNMPVEQDLDGDDESPQEGELARDLPEDTQGIIGEDAKGNLSEWEMVCRPKVGEKTQGGGFYLILRRIGRQGGNTESNEARDAEALNGDMVPQVLDKQEGDIAGTDTMQ
ncbi:hypothetical protein ABW19_dt0207245 [Dactylella cylindrospora]|nr:hypothetical protein ABW19_dt0207245 [Dactylella cylindrospora]